MEISFARMALLAATLFFTGCDSAPDATQVPASAPVMLEGKTMGTFWRVSVVDIDAARAEKLRNRSVRSWMLTIGFSRRIKMIPH